MPILILLYYIGGLLVSFGVILAFFRWCWRVLRPMWKGIREFLRDWHGEPPRPGFAGVPGVMIRIQTVEDTVKFLKAEVSPNSGTSMKDTVNRVETDVKDVAKRMEQLERQRADRDGA